MPHLKSGGMAGFGIRGGRREAQENIEVKEEGDCPRCGGESQPSSMESYLECSRCNYEWKDPNATSTKRIERPTYHQESEMIDQLGGWSNQSVGQGYGEGYSLKYISEKILELEPT